MVSQRELHDRDAMRRALRRRRRAVSAGAQVAAARSFARIAGEAHLLRPALRLAAYLACAGEADVGPLMARAQRLNCRLFLPTVISPRRSLMRFVRYSRSASLQRNLFGILEPRYVACAAIAPLELDVIFMPLLAFDDSGWRLGSGAGFYDRCLRHLHAERQWRRPKLIGIAYEFQRVAQLQPQRWDIPLDGVITEQCFRRLPAAQEERCR
jgi:5-formyltetrahydrofolate cyclo-ligase